MLRGIDALLTGDLLRHLDHMGHSDAVVIADAHFPAHRIGAAVVDVAASAPRVAAAVCSVLELDDVEPVVLMDSGDAWNGVQSEIVSAVGLDAGSVRSIERFAFYEAAARAAVIVRTAETRTFGNVILRKGVIPTVA